MGVVSAIVGVAIGVLARRLTQRTLRAAALGDSLRSRFVAALLAKGILKHAREAF